MLYVAIIYHRNPQSFRQMNIYRIKSHRVFICRKPSDNHKVTKYVLFGLTPKLLGKMCTFAIFHLLKINVTQLYVLAYVIIFTQCPNILCG